MGAQGARAGGTGLGQGAPGARADVLGCPVRPVCQRGLDGGEQARCRGFGAGPQKGLVQMNMRIDRTRQHLPDGRAMHRLDPRDPPVFDLQRDGAAAEGDAIKSHV